MLEKLTRIFKRAKDSGDSSASSHTPREGGSPLLFFPAGSALAVATVFRCVRILSDSVGSLEIMYRRRTREGIMEDAGDFWMDYILNVQSDTALSAFDMKRTLIQELLLQGNAYIVPVYSAAEGRLERLVLCNRGTVSHDIINNQYTVNDIENRIRGVYREDEIIHVKGFPGASPKIGMSVLGYARTAIDIARTGDRETLHRFSNGGNVRGIVSNGPIGKGFNEYMDEELAKTAKDLDARFYGGQRIVSLPGQVDFKQISLSSTDMQFLESRKFSVLEICRFFGVHPSFVFSDTSTNYKSAEQANMAFLSHTLAPLLRNIEGELRRKLLTPSMAKKYLFTFDIRSLHTTDLAGMADYHAKRLQTGASINEIRREQNLPPVKGGDRPMVSANLKSIDELTYGPIEEEEDPSKNKDDETDDTNTH